jgi:hypothetical protein
MLLGRSAIEKSRQNSDTRPKPNATTCPSGRRSRTGASEVFDMSSLWGEMKTYRVSQGSEIERYRKRMGSSAAAMYLDKQTWRCKYIIV